MVAVPMLTVFCIAGPVSTVSTVETPPEEPDKIFENARSQRPWTAPYVRSNEVSGSAPPDYLLTAGLINPRATQIGLVEAVQNIHSRKLNEGFNFATAIQELSHEIKKPVAVSSLTPNEVFVDNMRDLAGELQKELDPQAEEENLLKANDVPTPELENDNHGEKKRTTFFPRV